MENRSRGKAADYLELSKLRIMIPVSFTGFTGFFILRPELTPSIFLVTAGILFMAIAASVMNQVQEVDIDSVMPRTRNRPLPKKRIRMQEAQVFFFVMLLTGTILLSISGNFSAALIGLFTVVWYNGIYTNAKRLTPYAIIPGSLTGALPPLIGWVSAGGNVFDKTILLVCLLFFTGQIPHFLLLIIKYGNEYEKAGIPVITRTMSHLRISRITFASTALTALIAVYLGYSILHNRILLPVIIAGSLILLWKFSGLLQQKVHGSNYRKYFNAIDGYFLLVLILLIIDRIISPLGV